MKFKMPVDVVEVLTAAIDIEKARNVPVSVNLLIDESASPEFQAFVRAGFTSESPNSRLMISYFPTQTPDAALECDMTVIAAGSSGQVGGLAQAFRDNSIPTLVVAEHGDAVHDAAVAAGCAIPETDLVAPKQGQPFEEGIKGALGEEIGTWIARAGSDKSLALSIAYPFVRRPLAREAVLNTSLQNAGIGVVVFVPGADMPLMTANQAKMVLQIAAAYGQPLTADRAKEMAGVLLNAFFFRGVARTLAGALPVLGWAVKGTVGFVGTQAIGHAAIEYFEGGGNIAGLAAMVNKAVDSATTAADAVSGQPAVQGVAAAAAPGVRKVATVVLDAAAPVAQNAAQVVMSNLRPGRKGKAKRA